MARLVLAGRVCDDFERIEAHLLAHGADDIAGRLAEIAQALRLLEQHPLIGRRARAGWRELVIGRGARGYVALYRYDPVDDVVTVAAMRAQREAGFDEA